MPRWPGLLAAGLVAVLCLGPLVPFLRAGGGAWSAADGAALRFTLIQAALSAGVATLLAVPVARALARRRFRGRGALLALLGAPFLMPTIVAVMGLLAVFGRGGVINDGLALLGLPRVSIYGLGGVVGAHVVLNLPLALRLLLLAWAEVPAERFRLAAILDAPVFALIERPLLRRALPGILATIFALCLGSFTVALILGGGPRATTVELAIYQAIRFEGDFAGAAGLALVQLALGASAALLAALLVRAPAGGAVPGRPVERWDAAGPGARAGDALAVGAAAVILLAPLAAAVARGVAGLPDLPAEAGGALLRSLAVALGATALCLALALALALRGGLLAEAAGGLPLAASSLVLGLGALAVLGSRAGPWALPAAAVADALLALPFAVRALIPALAEIEARHGRLASQLGFSGWARVRLHLPLLRRPLGFAAGLASAFSVGNLGAVALLAGEGQATLPLLMARLMGAYRMDAGAAVGLLALGLALALFALFDRLGRG